VRIVLDPPADPATEQAVRTAVAVAARAASPGGRPGPWRAAALAEAVERDPGYAPSPRISRGATRA
jgi:hypothetical protein